jgi:hypothetical protein
MGRVAKPKLGSGEFSVQEAKRQIERTTGILFPSEDASDDVYCQCLVAQMVMLLHLRYGDPARVESEAIRMFSRGASFERYRPHLEKALGKSISGCVAEDCIAPSGLADARSGSDHV